MNIAITGMSGFIGKNLKSFFNEINNVNLISISRFESNASGRYTFEEFFNGDIDNEIDMFIHLASPNYDYCKDNSLQEGIVSLTQRIIESLPIYNCNKFIYFSSCKVYGESSLESTIFNETSELNPITDYAKAKVAAELIIKNNANKNGLSYLIYRLPFVYGYEMKSNIGLLLRLIDKSLPMISFKNGAGHKKSFLSIENIKRILAHNLKDPLSINNNIYNLSDFDPVTLDYFLTNYKKLSKSKSIIVRLPKLIFSIIVKLPIISNMVIKIYGNFHVENIKIKSHTELSLLTTNDCISNLVDRM